MPVIKKIQHILEYAGLRILVCIITLLPAPAAIRLGRGIGAALRFVFRSRMRLAHDNLQLAFGDSLSFAARSSIIDRLLRMQGESLIESIIGTRESIAQHVTIEGMEHLDRALEKKKGVILLGPHFDMWELAGYIFGAHLDSVATVYKSLKNPYVNQYLIKTREKSNLGLIPSKSALRPVFSRLKKGEAVVMMFDQNTGRNGVPVKFFGKTAMTYSAPATFALRTGCSVIPSYMFKEPGFRRHRLIIKEPFQLISTGDMEKDTLDNTQRYNDFFEDLVRRHPEQWFGWLHRRWKLPRTYSAAAAQGGSQL